MKSIYKLIVLIFILSVFNVFAVQELSLKELFDSPDTYDGEEIITQGEVVGDIISQGKNFWVNIKTEEYFIGVFLEEKDRVNIKKTSRYMMTGDVIRVKGIYNKSCSKHFGEQDIHIENLTVVKQGEEFKEEIDIKTVIMSFTLGILTILFLIYSNRKPCQQDISDEHQ
jgi:hypothetical protein